MQPCRAFRRMHCGQGRDPRPSTSFATTSCPSYPPNFPSWGLLYSGFSERAPSGPRARMNELIQLPEASALYHCAHMSVPAAFASTPTLTSPAIALPSDDNDNETDTDANSVLAAVVVLLVDLVDLAVRATIRVVHASGMHRAACISHCGLSWLREHLGRGGSRLAAGKVDNGERSM